MKRKYIDDFKNYLTNEIDPATEEIGKISKPGSRKHLQKLAYTNIVDRFDYCIDKVREIKPAYKSI